MIALLYLIAALGATNDLTALMPPVLPGPARVLQVGTNPAPPIKFGIAWPWTPTNGPVFFRIWMATNVQGPFSIIATSGSSPYTVTATNKVGFFHITSFNYNSGADSGFK